LPVKWAPTGQQFPSAGYTQVNEPMLSNQTYRPTARTGLDLPFSIPQPTSFGYQITPSQLREQTQQANRYLANNEYSRSVPQRTSAGDRGMN